MIEVIEMKDIIQDLALEHGGSILLAVMDGVGDITIPELNGKTPLEAAVTPNLDGLASAGSLGQHLPVGREAGRDIWRSSAMILLPAWWAGELLQPWE